MRASIVIPIFVLGIIGVLALTGCGASSESSASVNGSAETGESVDSETEAMGMIPSSKAGEHMGKEVTVRGLVKDYQWISGKPGRPTLLLFDTAALVERGSSISDQEIPDTFRVVVWKKDTRKWPPAPSFGAVFNKKIVCANGLIEDYDGSPAIVATEPSQLELDC